MKERERLPVTLRIGKQPLEGVPASLVLTDFQDQDMISQNSSRTAPESILALPTVSYSQASRAKLHTQAWQTRVSAFLHYRMRESISNHNCARDGDLQALKQTRREESLHATRPSLFFAGSEHTIRLEQNTVQPDATVLQSS